MPDQQTFDGHLAPVAWEAINRGWTVKRDELGNLLIDLGGGEQCLCWTVRYAAAPSNEDLGLGRLEASFAVVASVPVVDAVPLSRELLVEVNCWAEGRHFPAGTPQVTPVHRPELHEEAVRVTVDYRLAGAGFRPEEVTGVVADIAQEVGALREALQEKFEGRRQDAAILSDYDTPLAIGQEGEGELIVAPDSRVHQLDLFDGPVSRWRNAPGHDALPEVFRELFQRAKTEANNHGYDEPNPMLLAKAAARHNPAAVETLLGRGAFKRLMTLTNDELNRGSVWNVRTLLTRTAQKHDPTMVMVPHLFGEFLRQVPEMLEPLRGERDGILEGVGLPAPSDGKDSGKTGGPAPFKAPIRAMLERDLKKRVKGQDDVAEKVASRLAMSFRGLMGKSPRPKGVFLFAGPTGVGKTEMAKAIADSVYGPGDNLVRLDMSEFRERHTAARLIGSPPGYVGHNEAGGWLTTKVIENPRRVLLLDEFEKANPAVWQTFLQVFEEGRLTDGRGEAADFSQAVIVLTSNLGSRAAETRPTGFGQVLDGSVPVDVSRDVMEEVRRELPIELFNRIDGAFAFSPLDGELLVEIARAKLKIVKAELAEVGYELTFTGAVGRAIAAFEPEPALGARPVIRAIDRLVREPLVDLEPGTYKLCAPGGAVEVTPA